MSGALIMWGMLFGSLGIGFFLYGKRQGRPIPLLAGVILSVMPYAITDTSMLVAGGVLVTALPYFLRGR